MNRKPGPKIKKWINGASVFAILICTAASCGPTRPAGSRPHCAFADPEFTTSMGICNLAAEYYIANRRWPLSRSQLQEQNQKLQKLLAQTKELPPEEEKELSEFLDRFTLLELKPKGENLVLHYRFQIDRKTVDQNVTLRPGSTADEILETATD